MQRPDFSAVFEHIIQFCLDREDPEFCAFSLSSIVMYESEQFVV